MKRILQQLIFQNDYPWFASIKWQHSSFHSIVLLLTYLSFVLLFSLPVYSQDKSFTLAIADNKQTKPQPPQNLDAIKDQIIELEAFIRTNQYTLETQKELQQELQVLQAAKQQLETNVSANDKGKSPSFNSESPPSKVVKKQPMTFVPTPIVITDQKPPMVNIINFDLNHANEVATDKETIQGKVIDEGGVASVKIGGKEIVLDAKGGFSAKVQLVKGTNLINLVALDTRGNKTEIDLTLIRKITEEPASDTTALTTGDFGSFYAIVIGNNNYLYVPKLETAENDAKEVAQVLTLTYGFQVKLLLSAKRAEILNAINEFKSKLNSKDNLIIYYAGHGIKDESAYWLPVDAKKDNSTEWIQAETLTTELKKINSNHILVISDSCYSGELSRGLNTTTKQGNREYFLKKIFSQKSRTLIASGGNEPVADNGGGNHSIFTKAFLEGLKNAPDDFFTDEELFDRNIKEVVAGNTEQTPQYSALKNSGHQYGSFVFVKKR